MKTTYSGFQTWKQNIKIDTNRLNLKKGTVRENRNYTLKCNNSCRGSLRKLLIFGY